MYNSLNRDIEHFGDIYDRRINEYDNCEGVGEVIEKIRNNDPSWKSEDIVKQVPCIPIYKWDGKFYKDEASAKAGSTAEEIMSPAQDGTKADGKATSATSVEEPGEYVHKTGKFLMSSVYDTGAWSTPSLDGTYGWLARSDRKTSPGWMRMETVSGNIEMIKGVVTKGYNSGHHTSKFKVYVSRNGDSWKQMKDINNNEEFTGSVAQKTNYFNEPVEAKYIKFYPTAGAPWRSLNAGYVKDLSGTVNCTGGSGMFNDTPWFRFTFDEANTKSKSTYSEGTSDSNKSCPTNGNVMVRQKGNITIGDNNIPVGDLKIIQGGIVKGLKGVMGNKTLRACGADPSSPGWHSSSSGGSQKTWGACVKDKSSTTGDAFNNSDGGYIYMFRHWSGSNNNSIYDTGDGYNKWPDSDPPYKDNTQNSNANNGSTYSVPSTNFKVQDYESVNIVRQPCNRGTKGVLPTLGTGWTSDICSCLGELPSNQVSGGYTGTIYNITGGTEGWIDQTNKYTWANFFNNELQNLVTAKYSSGSFQSAVNEYKVVKKEGTTGNDNNNSYSSDWRDDYSKIDGKYGWHCANHSSNNWNSSLTNPKSVAKYDQSTEFIPIGIKIQPRNHPSRWSTQAPTEIRLVWSDGTNNKEQKVTLGTFSNKDSIKTILINPNKRTKTKKLHVFARHGRNNASVSFRINYLIGEINGGKSIDKGTIDCKNNEKRPVECKDGAAAGTESSYGAWTDRSVSWSYDAECSKDSTDNWSRKKKKTSGQQAQRYYKTVAPQHGGKNNCERKLEDTKYRDVNDSDSCSWSYRSGVNEACYWIGSASYYGAKEAKNGTSAASSADQCKTLTNTKGRPYCQFLHTSADGGQYALETRNTCDVVKCHRAGSGKCNTHGGWGGWMVDS